MSKEFHDNLIGIFAVIGGIAGLALASEQPNAEAGTYIAGGLLGAVIGAIAGKVLWMALVFVIVVIAIALNVAGVIGANVVRKEVGKTIIESIQSDSPKQPSYRQASLTNYYVYGVCLENKSQNIKSVNYGISWNSEVDWNNYTTKSEYINYWYSTTPFITAPTTSVRFDYKFAEGYQEKIYRVYPKLAMISARSEADLKTKVRCITFKRYFFDVSNQGLDLYHYSNEGP